MYSRRKFNITFLYHNREKLGIPEDESISIKGVVAKRKEETKKIEELIRQNKNLVEENLELKSDVRIYKYYFEELCATHPIRDT